MIGQTKRTAVRAENLKAWRAAAYSAGDRASGEKKPPEQLDEGLKKMTKRMILPTLMLGASLNGLAAAMAVAADEGVQERDVIYVTAERREENIQDVSISMTALSGENIDDLGIEDAAQIGQYVPGLEVRENGLFAGYFVRGVGVQTETNDINEQPVSVYIDDVYLGIPTAQRGQLFDLERVEVLRGPQGTNFGRNTPGGVMHFISKKPTEEFEGYVEGQYGSFGQWIVEGAVNVPITDKIRTRISVKQNQDDGWQEDIFTGVKFSDTNVLSGRGQLAIDVTDRFDVLIKGDIMRQRANGLRYGFSGLLDPDTYAPCTLDRVNAHECVAINGYQDPVFDDGKIATDTDPVDDIDAWGVSGQINYDFGKVTLTSITAYRELERAWAVDGDASNILIFGFFNFDTYRTTDSNQFSQELRFSGEAGAASWVAGAYYYSDHRDFLNQFPAFGGGDVTVVDTESWALFTQVDLSITDQLTLIGGVRYTDETKDALKYSNDNPAVIVTPSLDDQVTTGKMALEWKPADDLMLYASFSTGFKSGTFSAGVNDVVVDPEKATAYEAGVKSSFWDGRAVFNAALYYNKYRDFQATGTALNEFNIPINQLVNVGAMNVYGLEGDFKITPQDNLLITLGVALADGEIDADPTQASGAVDYETGQPFYFDGNRPPQLPKYSLNGSINYILPVDPQTGEWSLQFNWKYSGMMYLDANNNRLHVQPAYEVLGVSAKWEAPNERFYVQAFANNLTNQQVAGWSFDITGFVENRSTVWGQRPRSYGVRAGLRF